MPSGRVADRYFSRCAELITPLLACVSSQNDGSCPTQMTNDGLRLARKGSGRTLRLKRSAGTIAGSFARPRREHYSDIAVAHSFACRKDAKCVPGRGEKHVMAKSPANLRDESAGGGVTNQERRDAKAADRPPGPGAEDRAGFDLGGAVPDTTAGTGLGLGDDASESGLDRRLPGRRPKNKLGLPRFSGGLGKHK